MKFPQRFFADNPQNMKFHTTFVADNPQNINAQKIK